MREPRFTVSALVPAFNEEKTIASIVERCLPYVNEVIVVNDGSTDATSINARNAGAKVIELEHNMGVLRATQLGFREAQGDIIVTLDADGQHDPDEIPKLIQPILNGEAELVMGERPYFPYLSEKILTCLTSLRVPCGDAATGFRGIKRAVVDQMNIHGACLCGTFVIEAARHGARVCCVPVSIRERDAERRIQTSHLKQFFIILWDIIRSM